MHGPAEHHRQSKLASAFPRRTPQRPYFGRVFSWPPRSTTDEKAGSASALPPTSAAQRMGFARRRAQRTNMAARYLDAADTMMATPVISLPYRPQRPIMPSMLMMITTFFTSAFRSEGARPIERTRRGQAPMQPMHAAALISPFSSGEPRKYDIRLRHAAIAAPMLFTRTPLYRRQARCAPGDKPMPPFAAYTAR